MPAAGEVAMYPRCTHHLSHIRTTSKTRFAAIGARSAIVSSIPDILSIYSKTSEKVDNIMPESLDNFLRNQCTTSMGIGGQLAPEYASMPRETSWLFVRPSTCSLSGSTPPVVSLLYQRRQRARKGQPTYRAVKRHSWGELSCLVPISI